MVAIGVPFNCATDEAINPLPLIVAVNTPKGSGPLLTLVITGAGGMSVTVAEAEPFDPVSVTVSVPEAGSEAGAVYRPVALIVPETADHDVALTFVNCWVAPNCRLTDEGLMADTEKRFTVTVVDEDSDVAVTVTVLCAGMTVGAV